MRIRPLAYRLLLLVLPADLRREFGEEMAALFAMQLAEARRDRRSLVRLWIRAAIDAGVSGIQERAGAASVRVARTDPPPPRSRRCGVLRAC